MKSTTGPGLLPVTINTLLDICYTCVKLMYVPYSNTALMETFCLQFSYIPISLQEELQIGSHVIRNTVSHCSEMEAMETFTLLMCRMCYSFDNETIMPEVCDILTV